MESTEKKFNIKKILNIVFNVLFYLFIIFLLVFAIANIRSRSEDGNNIPNIFGRGFLNVDSDSMDGQKEDSFVVGDLVFVKIVNDQEDLEDLKVGDIITFYDSLLNTDIKLNTHRIVEIQENAGVTYYITQGDKAVSLGHVYIPGETNEDLRDIHGTPVHEYFQVISGSDIKAIYTGKWSGAGKVLKFLQQPLGFGLCIVLPTFLLLAFEVFVLIKNVMKLKAEKVQEENKQSLEEEKERIRQEEKEKMRQELLEEMKREKQLNESSENKPADGSQDNENK